MSGMLKKIKDLLIAKLTADEIIQLEEIAKPVAPVTTPVTLKEVKTKDGLKTLSYDGELAEGVMVNDMSTGVPIPAEGEYELADGTKISCAAGKVTKIEKVAAAAPEMAAMVAQMSAIEVKYSADVKALKESNDKEILELKKSNQFLAVTLKKILDTPIHQGKEEKKLTGKLTDAEYKSLSSFEQVKYNRGEL